MKRLRIGLICVVLLLGLTNLNAQAKAEKENSKGFMLTAGGGLALDAPSIEIVHDGYVDWNYGTSKTNTFVAFGFSVLGNVTFSYQIKDEWSIGAAVNLGYNFMGGPHAIFEARYKHERYSNTFVGLGKLYHSFLADINFCGRTPSKKGGDLILEAGLRMMPTWSYAVYKEAGVLHVGDTAFSREPYVFNKVTDFFSYPGYEGTMMAGPNIFIGIDYYLTKIFDLIAGVRFSAVFGCSNPKYLYAGIIDQSYLNSIIQVAFEFKFNYYHIF